MDETMGNQQATSHQLAWLAGIWDGEGTFQILRLPRKNKEFYTARLTLTNTDVAMVNEITKILDSFGVAGHLWLENGRKKHHRDAYHLTVNKLKNVKRASELMLPYLVNKKPNAEVLIRFVASRLNYKKVPIRDNNTGRIVGMSSQGYSKEEKSLYQQLRELNGTL